MLVEKIIMFFYNEHPPYLYEKLLMMLLVKVKKWNIRIRLIVYLIFALVL